MPVENKEQPIKSSINVTILPTLGPTVMRVAGNALNAIRFLRKTYFNS